MTNQEMENLKDLIQFKMLEVNSLQEKYQQQTGKEFIISGPRNMPVDYSTWTSGSWSIGWFDGDHISIKGSYNQRCIIAGGDFEGVLSGLCAAFSEGNNRPTA